MCSILVLIRAGIGENELLRAMIFIITVQVTQMVALALCYCTCCDLPGVYPSVVTELHLLLLIVQLRYETSFGLRLLSLVSGAASCIFVSPSCTSSSSPPFGG